MRKRLPNLACPEAAAARAAGSAGDAAALLRRDSTFERFPNEARIGNATHFCSRLHRRRQRLRYAHIDLVVLLLELKFCRFELRACLSVLSRGIFFFINGNPLENALQRKLCRGDEAAGVNLPASRLYLRQIVV